jgi:hypothetical protein
MLRHRIGILSALYQQVEHVLLISSGNVLLLLEFNKLLNNLILYGTEVIASYMQTVIE